MDPNVTIYVLILSCLVSITIERVRAMEHLQDGKVVDKTAGMQYNLP
jgi:hypothetical protein